MAKEQGRFTGKTIGNYNIRQLLGRGRFGEAYKADFLIHQNTPVVVKFLLDASNPKQLEEFLREARTQAKLDHPNIVPFYHYDVYENPSEKIPYIVMAFANNKSIKEQINRQKLLPFDQAIGYLAQTAEGLEYAHSKKVLHRDLKPANLLLHKERASQQAVVWLSDFGIAITAHRLDTAKVDLTKQAVIGSWQYMSPEQFKGNARIPSDIYSLGIIAYLLLTGDLPFPIDKSKFTNPFDLMMAFYNAHEKTPVPSFEQTRRRHGYDMTLPVGELEEVVTKALAKEPKDRYQSAGDFHDNLERTYRKALEKEAENKRILVMQIAEV